MNNKSKKLSIIKILRWVVLKFPCLSSVTVLNQSISIEK